MKKIIVIMVITVVMNTVLATNTFGHASGESNTSSPIIMSEAAIMIDPVSGAVVYEKNANQQMYPASLTKIATAIYAIETGNLEEVATVSSKATEVEGTRVYLEEGEQVTLKKLVQGLLINSGNDAGVAIAETLDESVEQFSSEINDYLKNQIGVDNTHFENPHGLHDPEHFTTAEDMAKITQYAMKNETFQEVFGTDKLKWNGESWDTTIFTHHKLMREMPYEGITGGKNGFVNQSGFTLATTAERKDLSLIVITLKSNIQSNAYEDTTDLLDYGFENFETASISEGTTFLIGDDEYRASEELFYTRPLDEEVNKDVTDNGRLEITNQGGTVLNSYKLNKVEKTETLKEPAKMPEEVKTSSIFGDHFSEFVIIVLIIALSIVGMIYRQIKKI